MLLCYFISHLSFSFQIARFPVRSSLEGLRVLLATVASRFCWYSVKLCYLESVYSEALMYSSPLYVNSFTVIIPILQEYLHHYW